ncbi:DUF982 domain-containing protein [Rhizobium sp. BK251]|uniref:DUF982 domain-containing protein n=1 Tax=Rhizobium sp. BK251 TaxID=2512125 RepID=UPI00104E578D|nr:DUF982 domain-containing protein [Rhizobium sp. BK251]TCL63276.1 uncharacterized protein DUF982 [Rhizobium sp. BK251]
MAPSFFDRAVYVQRSHFIDEITCLEEAFDLLDDWPHERRDLAYETLYRACRKAAQGAFPLSAVRENFERFVKKSGMLAEVGGVSSFFVMARNRNVGSA